MFQYNSEADFPAFLKKETSMMDDNALNSSYGSASSATSALNTSSSSKAVLAALRALQDKIRRLESERSQALDEATQLRHQLKNHELEAEHSKQREQLTSQRSLQEVRGAYDRLLTEKTDLEVRLTRLEEKNRTAQDTANEMQAKIRALEEEKTNTMAMIRDYENQYKQVENQIKHAQRMEKDFAQSMVWENKRHEEDVAFNQRRIETLEAKLASVSHERGAADVKLQELDELVAQLLSVNESLVSQLSGRPLKIDMFSNGGSSSSSSGGDGNSSGVKTKTKKVKKITVPRAASAPTTASKLGKTEKFSKRQGSQLVPINMNDVEQLKHMHKMYANMARNIHRPGSSMSATAASVGTRRKKTTASMGFTSSSSSSSSSSVGKAKNSTRLSRKKAAAAAASDYTSSSGANVDVRIPKPAVSFERGGSDAEFDDVSSRGSSSRKNVHSSHYSGTQGAGDSAVAQSIVDQHREKAEMHAVISELEEEFDSLNAQYRRLLSSAQGAPSTATSDGYPTAATATAAGGIDTSSTGGGGIARGGGSAAVDYSAEGIQAQAEEIVDVIHKLHKKGEQIRTLKNSP